MEHVLQEDAIMLTNIVTELTKAGTPTSIQSIISAAVLSNLWLLIDGTKYALKTKQENIIFLKCYFMKNPSYANSVNISFETPCVFQSLDST